MDRPCALNFDFWPRPTLSGTSVFWGSTGLVRYISIFGLDRPCQGHLELLLLFFEVLCRTSMHYDITQDIIILCNTTYYDVLFLYCDVLRDTLGYWKALQGATPQSAVLGHITRCYKAPRRAASYYGLLQRAGGYYEVLRGRMYYDVLRGTAVCFDLLFGIVRFKKTGTNL